MVGHKILEINMGEQGQLSNTETNMEAFVDFLDFKCFFLYRERELPYCCYLLSPVMKRAFNDAQTSSTLSRNCTI